MFRLPAWLDRYRTLPSRVIWFAAGQFLVNLITTAQFLLLNLFLKDRGLDDPSIAALTSQRFVATLLLAIPAGLWLRGRPLKAPLLAGAVLFPLAALVSLEAVRLDHMRLASAAFLAMGFGGLLLNVASLPMALRLAPADRSSETLSLLFSTWAGASIFGGVLSAALQGIGSVELAGHRIVFDEHAALLVLTIAAFAAPLCYLKLPDPTSKRDPSHHWLRIHGEDAPLLLRALVPTLCIATGAGLSIQFLNLFFSHVHHLGSTAYAAYGSVSNVLVLFAGLMVPEVKRRFGWRGAILGVQAVAVAILVVMGTTELWKQAAWALPLALACYVLRQPLMSMAGPSTNELTMVYVGERNRELVSACNGAIWSGAWWLAARTFEVLRTAGFTYWQVFLATAALYTVGILRYRTIIRVVERSESEATCEAPLPGPGEIPR
ncbi:MAG: MFS transporter [Verrucomicrobiae bacterium]|nr:MFS transporter [Verrucomicrobiae bacterium]MCP5545916.1 MFS transporter [Akkermansiaceae bacterium]